jgi:hypothetical protein
MSGARTVNGEARVNIRAFGDGQLGIYEENAHAQVLFAKVDLFTFAISDLSFFLSLCVCLYMCVCVCVCVCVWYESWQMPLREDAYKCGRNYMRAFQEYICG